MSEEMILRLFEALGQTIYMVSVSMVIAALIGIPLGVLLVTTAKGQILECVAFNRVLAGIVNAVRSVPFIILLVAIIPFTRIIVGTSIGTTAAMVPLTLAAIPFIGRQVENSIKEVPYGLIEAAQSLGATPLQIIRHVLLPEALSSIVSQLTTVIIGLIGASAMAGTIGGGGIGDLAIRYGYQRFRPDIMLATVVILIVVVQLVQFIGNRIAMRLNKK
ncbi:methionine ABC transporter permease [Pectinatus cerevisiiphilus]|uniref:D-methionine transport system permease protein n=1 Tax=Pectinatus cerevisiiphilus TaxID=86956 RepID=A0A4R3K729_9FIRM|nr:methionine ABC transporter permease [Pectinatus cerevisiiphilus]TCS78649.1 D-methionine transport system permease protein [Pectinatus cerevisiiphilus]